MAKDTEQKHEEQEMLESWIRHGNCRVKANEQKFVQIFSLCSTKTKVVKFFTHWKWGNWEVVPKIKIKLPCFSSEYHFLVIVLYFYISFPAVDYAIIWSTSSV